MSKKNFLRAWVLLIIGIIVMAGLALLLAFLGRGPGELAPMIPPPSPTPINDPVVASVNDQPINYSSWMKAVLLDQVMSGLAGQTAPAPDETLQRLIDEELVLQAVPPEQPFTAEQIETRITELERNWGVEDEAVAAALKQVNLTRPIFEQSIGRLLMVQASQDILEAQGRDIALWLEEQYASAEIQIFESAAALSVPTAQSVEPTTHVSPLPSPVIGSPLPSPTHKPETSSPTPLAIPKTASNFILKRVRGGTFTLTGQLSQGPVVLVFFQKCG